MYPFPLGLLLLPVFNLWTDQINEWIVILTTVLAVYCIEYEYTYISRLSKSFGKKIRNLSLLLEYFYFFEL